MKSSTCDSPSWVGYQFDVFANCRHLGHDAEAVDGGVLDEWPFEDTDLDAWVPHDAGPNAGALPLRRLQAQRPTPRGRLLEREMRFELTTSTLAIFFWPPTPFGDFSNINHNVSRGKWKVSAWWRVRPLEH